MNHGDYLDEVKVTLLEIEGKDNHIGMSTVQTLRELVQGVVDKV